MSLLCYVVLRFYVPPTAKVIRRRDLGLKSHPKDWISPRSNSRPLVYKVSSLTTTPLIVVQTRPQKSSPSERLWSLSVNK